MIFETDTNGYIKGPVIDTNPVFDSVVVDERSKFFDMEVQKMESGSYLDRPGDEYDVRFQFAFSTFEADFEIPVPYNIVFTLTDSPTDVEGVTYENWAWTHSTCTNIHYGLRPSMNPDPN